MVIYVFNINTYSKCKYSMQLVLHTNHKYTSPPHVAYIPSLKWDYSTIKSAANYYGKKYFCPRLSYAILDVKKHVVYMEKYLPVNWLFYSI